MTATAERDGHGGGGAGGTCPNCGTVRAGPFCQGCGQAAHIHHDLKGLAHDLAHGVLHVEGTFLATLPLLVRRPGELTARYVAGERARFVTPMALFLFAVFLLFAAVSRLALPDMGRTAPPEAVHGARQAAEAGAGRLRSLRQSQEARLAADPHADTVEIDRRIRHEERDLAVVEAMFPDAAPGTVQGGKPAEPRGPVTGIRAVDRQIRAFNENRALYGYKLKMASYKFSWALIPISLPFIWLLFPRRRDVGPYHHAIFAMHSLSFMTLLAAGLIGLHLLRVPGRLIALMLMLAPPFHLFRHFKGAYRLGRWGASWRTAVMLLFAVVAGGLFTLLLLWIETD